MMSALMARQDPQFGPVRFQHVRGVVGGGGEDEIAARLKTTCHLFDRGDFVTFAAFHNRAVPRVELAARRSPFGLNWI